jgi:hypothetical protein
MFINGVMEYTKSRDCASKSFDNDSRNYRINSKNILTSVQKVIYIKHEMALEAGVVFELSTNPNSIFGAWDYVSHQVIASPFKAIDYMDKMDVFGYRLFQTMTLFQNILLLKLKKVLLQLK